LDHFFSFNKDEVQSQKKYYTGIILRCNFQLAKNVLEVQVEPFTVKRNIWETKKKSHKKQILQSIISLNHICLHTLKQHLTLDLFQIRSINKL
jgi:hypothetical protein